MRGIAAASDNCCHRGAKAPLHFEIYYKETQNDSPITYELSVAKDRMGRSYVEEERLRQRRAGERNGRPLSFLHLMNGKGGRLRGQNASGCGLSKRRQAIQERFSDVYGSWQEEKRMSEADRSVHGPRAQYIAELPVFLGRIDKASGIINAG